MGQGNLDVQFLAQMGFFIYEDTNEDGENLAKEA
jgi:hypothetical protein